MDFLHIQHVIEGIVERAKIREDLFLEVAGKKSEGFAGFDGGAGEDDAVDLVRFQIGNRHGHGEIGFSRARRTDAEDQIIVPDGLDIGFLEKGFWEDGGFFCGDLDTAGPNAFQLFALTPMNRPKRIEEFVTADPKPVLPGQMELAKKFLGFCDMRFQTIDFEKGIANGDFHPEELFCFPKK